MYYVQSSLMYMYIHIHVWIFTLLQNEQIMLTTSRQLLALTTSASEATLMESPRKLQFKFSPRGFSLATHPFCSVPVGLEDVSKFPNLFAELIARGYSDDDVVKIAQGNLIRVLQTVEEVTD